MGPNGPMKMGSGGPMGPRAMMSPGPGGGRMQAFTCQNCGKQVTSENDKRAHTSEHISYLAHQCETCDKTFQTKPHRLKHVMSQEVPAKINHLREYFSSSSCKIRNPPRSTNNTKKMADTDKDSGPGVWEPRVDAPMYRVRVENTVEEEFSSTMDTVTLTKQTRQDIFYPQPDNGYLWHNNTKKKKQGITDTECVANLNTVWSYVTGGSGISSLETLVDLAELDTGGEMAMEGDNIDMKSVMLRQWLENIAPVRRYGMKLLKDCSEARTGLPKVGEVVVSEHKKKVDWERKLLMKELEEKEDTLANLVTYQSDLVSREWHSADGMTAPVYRQPGLGDGMKCESVNSAYSKAILGESELPPVHVRDKVGGPSPGVSSTGAPGSSPFPPTVASPALAPTPIPLLQPALPQSPVPQQPQAGLARAGTSVATTTPAPTAQAVVVGISQPLQQVGQQTIFRTL